MKQLFVSFDSFLCVLVCSQTLLHLIFVSFVVCFGGPIRCLKVGVSFRIVFGTFQVFNESLPMVWRSLCFLPVLPDKRQTKRPAEGKVGESPRQWRPLLFFNGHFGN
jgi:hypothetical protein